MSFTGLLGPHLLGRHQAFRSDGTWRDVAFDGYRYVCPKHEPFHEDDIKSKEFLHLEKDWKVDFPSIVLAYKPDDNKALYDRIKVVSNNFGGVQSQCAVMTKYEGQGNRKDQ